MNSNFVYLQAGNIKKRKRKVGYRFNMVWFCICKIQTELNKRWRRTLPGVRRENLEAVMNAGKLSWNTTCSVQQKYSYRHGINTCIHAYIDDEKLLSTFRRQYIIYLCRNIRRREQCREDCWCHRLYLKKVFQNLRSFVSISFMRF